MARFGNFTGPSTNGSWNSSSHPPSSASKSTPPASPSAPFSRTSPAPTGGFKVDRPLAGVLVIGGILLFVSMSLTAAVIVFCKKKNTVFVMQKCEEGQEGDDSDLELDDVLTDADSSADWRSGDIDCGGGGRYTPLALSSLPKLLISFDTDSGRRLVSLAAGTSTTFEEDGDAAGGAGGGGVFGNRFAREFPPCDEEVGSSGGGRRFRRIRRFGDGGGGGGDVGGSDSSGNDLCFELRRSAAQGGDEESGKLIAARDDESAAAEGVQTSAATEIADKLLPEGDDKAIGEAEGLNATGGGDEDDDEEEEDEDEGAEAEEAKPLRQLVTQV